MISIQFDRTPSRLARFHTLFRCFYPVVDCVPYKMGKRLGESVQNALVEVCRFTLECQFNLFRLLLRYVTNDTWKATEQLFHRHHSDLHYGALEFVQDLRLK